jgi:hypothetical protein
MDPTNKGPRASSQVSKTDPRRVEAAASPGSDPRQDREIQSPEQGNREVSWTPPSTLPDPDPKPGYVHRWVRIDTYGTPDPKNYNARMREGWEPCRAEDYPEITSQMMPNNPRGTAAGRNPDQSISGNIIIGGLMLCRMPQEIADARKRYYANLGERQLEAVNQSYMNNASPDMPKLNESRTRTRFGQGSSKDE